jgi:ribosomal protein L37AE/L43A
MRLGKSGKAKGKIFLTITCPVCKQKRESVRKSGFFVCDECKKKSKKINIKQ